MEKKERQERKNSTNGWTESCFHRSSLGPTEEEDCNGRRQAGAAVESRARGAKRACAQQHQCCLGPLQRKFEFEPRSDFTVRRPSPSSMNGVTVTVIYVKVRKLPIRLFGTVLRCCQDDRIFLGGLLNMANWLPIRCRDLNIT